MKAELDCNAVSTKTSANPTGSYKAAMAIQNCPEFSGGGELLYACVSQFLDEGYFGKGDDLGRSDSL